MAAAALLAGALVPVGAGATGVTEALEQRLRRLDRDIELSFPRFPERSTILSANGSRLATLFLEENRKVVRLKRIPQKARRAVLAIEDADFYEHSGIDPEAVGRALLTNVVSGEVQQGASTITQQLARRVVPGVGSEESVARKIREARVAVRLENRYSKDEILELYLNEVYFGGGAYGIATAAERYFGKRIGKINLREAALLAGTIAAPDRYSPLEDREAARDRRNAVLDRMAELGWVPVERAERAKERDIRLTDKEPLVERPSEAPFFVEYVKRQILNNPEFGQERSTRERVLYQGGLTVHTTLRPPLQRTAQRAAREHLPRPDDPEAALVAIQPGNGAIRALVGGRDFDQKKFDLATQGRRQAGSAFKPFTLVAALEEGISPRKRYDGSSPRRIPLPNGQTWDVENAGRGSFGRIDLVQATRQSVNVVYAQLIMDVGPKKAKQAAKRMGIDSELPAVPSLALGTAPVAPLEMASAFGTLANRGVRCEPFAIRKVEDRDGEIIFRHGKGDCERAIPKDISNRVVSILEGVVEGGTGTAASLGGRPVFGKTGTTDDFADAWFVGCTRQLCASTWVGHTEGRIPMRNVHGTTVYGGTFPARIWRDFMTPAMEGRPVRDFPPSADA